MRAVVRADGKFLVDEVDGVAHELGDVGQADDIAAVDADEEAFRQKTLKVVQPLDHGKRCRPASQVDVAITTRRFHVEDVGILDFMIIVLITDKQAVTLVTCLRRGGRSTFFDIYCHIEILILCLTGEPPAGLN